MAGIRNIPILTYHSIDESGSVISTSPEVFRRQMRRLKESGLTTVSLGTLSRVMIENGEFPTNSVILTFDDGFRNFYTAAFPVLDECGFGATVFLVTDFCGKNNDWNGNPPEMRSTELMSWSEIRELANRGIEFGSHTRTHPDLSRLAAAAVEREMTESKAAIEDVVGKQVTTFAYPFGKFGNAARQIAERIFETACSTDLGKVSGLSDPLSLERIDSYYLANWYAFDSFSSAKFGHYLKFRQSLRNFKALVSSSIS